MATVAIIGAGPSGLVAAKEAKACGLIPTVFEKSTMIGGLWKPGAEGSTWDDMHTNISHHTNRFSDFEWKEDIQDFPNRQEVYEYLCDYAKSFKINSHISLNTEVKKIQRAQDQWQVEYCDGNGHNTTNFDHVILCSGIFSKAHIPQIPGIESFPGTVIHSKEYKRPDAFERKEVVVIGNAFSGCEIASSLASKANHIVNVQHKPMWLLPRYLKKSYDSDVKIPCDLSFYSRGSMVNTYPMSAETINHGKNAFLRAMCKRQEQVCPDLQVKTPFTNPAFAAITDGYLDHVECGKIQVKTGSLKEVQGSDLLFEDGSQVTADALIFCTGYRADVPFLDSHTKSLMGFAPDDSLQPFLLHKSVFPKELPNMACVGLYRGPFFGVMELQARVASMAFAHKINLPTEEEIAKGIEAEKQIRDAIPRMQFPHGNYVQFCEEYAKMIGALPDLEQTKRENPELYQKLWSGPFTVSSYRLSGFGSNPELAMKAIDRINLAL